MSRYLPYGGHIFNRHKILNIRARNSFFYIWHPYVVELRYQKHWTKTDYINLNLGGTGSVSYSVPINTHHSTMDYKFKFKTLPEVREDVSMFRDKCPNAEVIDEINE